MEAQHGCRETSDGSSQKYKKQEELLFKGACRAFLLWPLTQCDTMILLCFYSSDPAVFAL